MPYDVSTYTGSSLNAGDTIFNFGGANGNTQGYAEYQIGSTGGVMEVVASGDGTNVLTTVLAMEDLCSTTPATRVTVTASNRHYLVKGHYKRLTVRQNGAAAVTGAYCIKVEPN